jgi:hypothetical protein
MFYFFRKGEEYLRCELRPRENGSCDLFIQEPGADERVEHFRRPEDAQERWEELRIRFNVDGWAGPFGRE